jgi:ceramide glucosyltransferase
MDIDHDLLLGFVAFAVLVQLLTIVLAFAKQHSRGRGILGQPKVTVLRPLCGLENNLEETLTSTFAADYPDFEVVLCVANPRDPVIALARRIMAAHPGVPSRLLIGEAAISGNPKLNNIAKGWRAARAEWILMADSNVLLPRDYIQRLLAEWREDTGLVTSPPAGIRPEGFAARLECAFLNTLQGRFQLASAAMGNGFAQGKMLFWHRDLLENAGGIEVLGREMAEDVASTKLVRAAGLKVRLCARLFEQPIGRRDFRTVWSRQLRWAKVRRLGFLGLFLPEVFAGGLVPILAALVLAALGVLPMAAVALLVIGWYGAELLLARASGWPAGPMDLLAFVARDLLLLPLWCAAWAGNGFEWRGNQMTADEVQGATEPGEVVQAAPLKV